GMLVYLAYYLLTNLGMFACVSAMRRDGEPVEDIRQLAGLSRTQPWFAFAMGALTLSLAGLPPLANIVASVAGAFYYLRILQIMYFDDQVRGFDRGIGGGTHAIMWGTSFVSMFFVVVPAPLILLAGSAAHALFP